MAVLGVGTIAGDEYKPAALIVPIEEFPPAMPLTLQLTAVLADPVTVAVKVSDEPVESPGFSGLTLTTTAARIVAVPVPDFVGSATLVAVTVTVAGAGATAGAVNNPAGEIVPHVAPAQPAPFSAHVTAVFAVPVTVALNCCDCAAITFTVEGPTDT